MINTKRYIKLNHENRSRKSPEQDMNFQDQHYEHKPHFEYRVEYINKEHEAFMFLVNVSLLMTIESNTLTKNMRLPCSLLMYSMFIVNDDDEL